MYILYIVFVYKDIKQTLTCFLWEVYFPSGTELIYLSFPTSEQVCKKGGGQRRYCFVNWISGNRPFGPSVVLVGCHLTLKF